MLAQNRTFRNRPISANLANMNGRRLLGAEIPWSMSVMPAPTDGTMNGCSMSATDLWRSEADRAQSPLIA